MLYFGNNNQRPQAKNKLQNLSKYIGKIIVDRKN